MLGIKSRFSTLSCHENPERDPLKHKKLIHQGCSGQPKRYKLAFAGSLLWMYKDSSDKGFLIKKSRFLKVRNFKRRTFLRPTSIREASNVLRAPISKTHYVSLIRRFKQTNAFYGLKLTTLWLNTLKSHAQRDESVPPNWIANSNQIARHRY